MKKLFLLFLIILFNTIAVFAQIGDTPTEVPTELEEAQTESPTTENSSDDSDNSIVDDSFVEEVYQTKETIDIQPEKAERSFEKVGIFGHDFLRENDFAFFDQAEDAEIRGEYILGPGDNMSISVWGDTQVITDNFTITKDGAIDFSGDLETKRYGFGRIFLGGLSYDEAKQVLEKEYTRYFNFDIQDFKVRIIGVRNINIEIVGQVEKPGNYRVPAINTVYNILKKSGGPTINGSARDIQIKRDGKVIQILDIYEYLVDGITEQNIYLQDNDIIFIPPIHRLVALQGAIRRPTRYELLPEENFPELLHFSGGFQPNALKSRLQVFRYENDDYVLKDYTFNENEPNTFTGKLVDGDSISIKYIPAVANNIVEAKGALNQAGTYEFENGMRVLDLIERANGLRFDAVTDKAYLTRLDEDLRRVNLSINLKDIIDDPDNEQNYVLFPRDELEIFSKSRFAESFAVEIFGRVKEPGQYLFGSSLTLQDLLIKAGGFQSDALTNEIELRRVVDYSEEEGRLIPIMNTVEKIQVDYTYLNPDNQNNLIELRPYDQIFVRSIPEFDVPRVARVNGEVLLPGAYPILRKDMRLTDLIEVSGGVTPFAYKEGAKFYRRNGDLYLVDLKEVERRPSSKYNYIIKPGDRLIIPTIDEAVTIVGAINSKTSNLAQKSSGLILKELELERDSLLFLTQQGVEGLEEYNVQPTVVNTAFRGNKNAKWYINEFGAGFDKNAWKRKTQVIYPNGKSNGTRKFLFFNFYPEVQPGSDILVEYKPPKPPKEEGSGFFGSLTAEKTLVLLSSAVTTTTLIIVAANR